MEKLFTAMELKELADKYRDTDPSLAGVIIALASCRIVDEKIGVPVFETDLIMRCAESGTNIQEFVNNLVDDHKADLN